MEGDETREKGKGVLCRRNKKACINCSKKCLPVSDTDTASFFKVMLGDFTQFLYIPPAFAQTMTDLLDKNILLEDSSGARWSVRVCMKRRCLAFGHGWCRFVLDHSIDVGEFLVFRKVSKSIFVVQIFSISGCERLSVYETKKRSRNKRKRMQTKNDRIPTIHEVTRKDERRARRTNSIIRRLIMEDIENEDLLVKDELPIITPIATMPSDYKPTVYSQRILGRSPITKFYARTRKNAAKTSTKAAIDEAKLVQALQDEPLASNQLRDQQMQQVLTPAAATDTDSLQKEDAI
ncbi:B3 domain-containing protein [Carex littledalei]|uniref:B3 domain-containing protein n=1 Tax=Carex littledalei TaxID=544730 RepID=A0A833RK72_9POAL|nr:B3 domain-containing protein [Carex littledalei]